MNFGRTKTFSILFEKLQSREQRILSTAPCCRFFAIERLCLALPRCYSQFISTLCAKSAVRLIHRAAGGTDFLRLRPLRRRLLRCGRCRLLRRGRGAARIRSLLLFRRSLSQHRLAAGGAKAVSLGNHCAAARTFFQILIDIRRLIFGHRRTAGAAERCDSRNLRTAFFTADHAFNILNFLPALCNPVFCLQKRTDHS